MKTAITIDLQLNLTSKELEDRLIKAIKTKDIELTTQLLEYWKWNVAHKF